MLADVDEVRQRMDQPENQSQLAPERQQLDQTRQDIQRAADAAAQGSVAQALASGTRAQRSLQQMRDDLRKENSSRFADDLREMRNDARDLARQQDELGRKLGVLGNNPRKTLGDAGDRKDLLDEVAQQKEKMNKLVDRATQVSEQAENTEPLLSRQLYDSIRKLSTDDANTVKQAKQELLSSGTMTRDLLDRLEKTEGAEGGGKALDLTGEMLRAGYFPQAGQAGQRAGAEIDELKRGVERAAESILGDDAEQLKLAQSELDQITDQLRREIAQAQGRAPNGETPGQRSGSGDAPAGSRPGDQGAQPGPPPAEPSGPRNGELVGADGNAQPRDGAPTGQQPRGAGQPADRQRGRDGQSGGGERGGFNVDNILNGGGADRGADRGDVVAGGPIAGGNFGPWTDRLRDVEELLDAPDLRNAVATAREQARLVRRDAVQARMKPDWTVVQLKVLQPLVEVRSRVAEELARRDSKDSLAPIDRDPVPNRFAESVRRYYEELGKDK